MAKTNATGSNNRIEAAKKAFIEQFKLLLSAVQTNVDANAIHHIITDVHTKAIKFFTFFEKSIAEQGLKRADTDENTINAKIDEAVKISNTILKYWKLLRLLGNTYDIRVPEPSERAHSALQAFLKTYNEEKAKELHVEFRKENLPTYGFESSRKIVDITEKQQITYGILAGTVFLIALLVIILLVKCPTETQDNIFTTISALAAASFFAAIIAFLNISYCQVITAGGALAIFMAAFLLKPAQLSMFTSCNASISGRVYYGEKPQPNVEIQLLKQNLLTNSDGFGDFSLPIDYYTVDPVMQIQLRKTDLGIDTIIGLSKSEIRKSLDISVTQHCVTCVQKDSSEVVIDKSQACSGSNDYIREYIEDYTRIGAEQGRAVDCQVRQFVKR